MTLLHILKLFIESTEEIEMAFIIFERVRTRQESTGILFHVGLSSNAKTWTGVETSADKRCPHRAVAEGKERKSFFGYLKKSRKTSSSQSVSLFREWLHFPRDHLVTLER